jgi:hypothetical protein
MRAICPAQHILLGLVTLTLSLLVEEGNIKLPIMLFHMLNNIYFSAT